MFMSDFFYDPLEDKMVYYISFRVSRRSFCASPIFRPRLRLGFQFLGLAQEDSLLLLLFLLAIHASLA
jgi:hypothetical protein